jgi:hypothetical protein
MSKPLLILLAGLAGIATLLFSEFSSPPAPGKRQAAQTPELAPLATATASIASSSPTATAAADDPPFLLALLDAGWNREAALAVTQLNQEWLTILQEENPAALEQQIAVLAKLGSYSAVMSTIQHHPEIAGLLAMADDPTRFVASLTTDECFPDIIGLYTQHPDRDDAIELSKILQENRALICRLLERGLVGAQAIFWFPREESNRPGWQVYEHWARNFLEQRVSGSDEELSMAVVVLLEQGEYIRRRLIDSSDFRAKFESDLWPRFERAASKAGLPYEVYLDDPHLWDVAALNDGEKLLESWEWTLDVIGVSPGDILFGSADTPVYPESLHVRLTQAMLQQNKLRMETLVSFGPDAVFRQLLDRQLPEHLEDIAFEKLWQQEYPQKYLEDLLKTDTADIANELRGAEGGTLKTFKKLAQGRDVSGGEMFWAAFDTADAVWAVATMGTGTVLT